MPLTAAIHTCPEFADASSMPLRVSLVNLQKLTLWACVDAASIWMLAPAQNTLSTPPVTTTTLHLGVLEAQPLDDVVQLDVDAEVVRVQLQLVVVAKPGIRCHRHRHGGDRSIECDPPVPVRLRVRTETDRLLSGHFSHLSVRSRYIALHWVGMPRCW